MLHSLGAAICQVDREGEGLDIRRAPLPQISTKPGPFLQIRSLRVRLNHRLPLISDIMCEHVKNKRISAPQMSQANIVTLGF